MLHFIVTGVSAMECIKCLFRTTLASDSAPPMDASWVFVPHSFLHRCPLGEHSI